MKNNLQKYNACTKLMEWSERVAACRSNGMRVKAWCAQEGISEKTYYYWQTIQTEREKEFEHIEEEKGTPEKESGETAFGCHGGLSPTSGTPRTSIY